MKRATPEPIQKYAVGIYDGPHATPKEASEGPIFLGIKNITDDGRLDLSDIRHISEHDFPKWTRRVTPQPNDIVFTYEATLHRYALIPQGFRGCLGRRLALIRPDHTKVDAKYLLYYFLSHNWRTVVEGFVKPGATVDRIPLEQFPRFPVAFPDLPTQRKTASMLSAYDDLIENNQRRMALLDESARLLYREWFVRLRFPGHEHSRIVDGVPEGWERKALTEIADFRLGKMLDQKKNKGDLMPYLANVNVRWGEFDFHNLREMRFEENELHTFGLRYGDIVMCEGGEPGRCAIWKEQLPKMMIQKALHRIRARENIDRVYLYYNLRFKGQSGQLATLFTGATIKHLPREKLAIVKIELPPNRLMALFSDQIGPIEDQIGLLHTANRRATKARDLLLPRLMRGEIAV